jgi:cell division protein FtsB
MSWEQDPWMNPEFRMASRPPQRDWRAGRRRVLTILGCTIGAYAIYLLVGGEFGFWRLHSLQGQEVRLAGEIAVAQDRVDVLKQDLKNINETREREARLGFGFAKPNELIYEIVPADSMGAAPETQPDPATFEPARPAEPVKRAEPVQKRPTSRPPAKKTR